MWVPLRQLLNPPRLVLHGCGVVHLAPGAALAISQLMGLAGSMINLGVEVSHNQSLSLGEFFLLFDESHKNCVVDDEELLPEK